MIIFSGEKEEVVLFSPISGKLTFEGKPASNAKIIRWITYKDSVGEKDIFYADEYGSFHLPIKTTLMKLPLLLQLSISQEINIVFDNKQYLVWTMGKGNTDLFGELGGELVNFQCELSEDLIRVDVPNGLLGTSCKWDPIVKEYKNDA